MSKEMKQNITIESHFGILLKKKGRKIKTKDHRRILYNEKGLIIATGYDDIYEYLGKVKDYYDSLPG